MDRTPAAPVFPATGPLPPPGCRLPFASQRGVAASSLAFAILLIALPLVITGLDLGNFWIRLLAMALLYVMLALGLNIVVGMAGLLDLGYVAFYAVGAYGYALLSSPHLSMNFDWIANLAPAGVHLTILIVLPFCLFLAALFGVLLGIPVLKLRGDYLAIVTLGFGEIIRIFLLNLNSPVNLTNGPQGVGEIQPVQLGPLNLARSVDVFGFTISSVTWYYYLFLIFAALIIVVCVRLQDSRIGRAWMAVREDEIAAKAMGINTRNMKLLAFGMGASFGGISGAMFAAFQGFISPESFVLHESIVIVAMVVLGGMGHIPGVILGAVLLYAIPEALRIWAKPAQEMLFGHEYIAPEALRMLLFGLALVLIMLFRPRGLWPAPQHGEKRVLPTAGGSGNAPGGPAVTAAGTAALPPAAGQT